MPLTLTVSETSPFSDKELEMITSFNYGMISMHIGLPCVTGGYGYPKNWSWKEYYYRLWDYLTLYNMKGYDIMTKDLVKRMAENHFYCNISHKTRKEWNNTVKRRLLNRHREELTSKLGEINEL